MEVLVVIGIAFPAFLSIFFEEVVYSVGALVVVFTLVSALYFSLDAPLAAVFQLALGVGTSVTLFLVGEEVATRTTESSYRDKTLLIVAFVLLLIPATLFELPLFDFSRVKTPSEEMGVTLSYELWNLRGVDVLAQGIVVLTAVVTLAILLGKEGGGK